MIIGLPVSTKQFTYTKSEKTFSMELSDMKGFPFFGQLYDDSLSVAGFVLVSHKTGLSQAYYLNRTIYSDSGEDIAGFEFLPAEPVRESAKGTKVILWND